MIFSFFFEGDFFGLLNNVNLLSFIIFVILFLFFIRCFFKNIWNCFWLVFLILLIVVIICVLVIFLVFRRGRLLLFFLKGFFKILNEWMRVLICVWNFFWIFFICLWWWMFGFLFWFVLIVLWIDLNFVISLVILGFDIIYLRSWVEFFVNFMVLLFFMII